MISLVISIIVMLILAGVSINAVIGDNGILTRTQDAVVLNSCAILEEFLQQEATNYYEETENYKTQFALLKSKHPEWFYQNSQGYIMDDDGHALYLIKKSGLPEEIQNQLTGGNAERASEFYSQKDVYGTTSDLQVYYCANGVDTILGLNKEELDKDNPFTIAYEADSLLAQVINGGTEALTNQDLKAITTLTLDESNKALLKELRNLESLKMLTLNNITITDNSGLDGIELAPKLNVINIQNCTISNYSAIGNCPALVSLYLINTNDIEVNKFTSSTTGIGGKSIPTLNFFGIYGTSDNTKNVTDISGLANLDANTQAQITDLYLRYNSLTDLSALSGFTGVKNLYINNNSTLETLKGISNMKQLEYLYAANCNLGNSETAMADASLDSLVPLEIKNSLYYVDLQNNANLKHIKYITNANKKDDGTFGEITIRFLYLAGCTNLVDTGEISDVIIACGKNYSIPSTYSSNFLASDVIRLDLNNQTITESQFRELTNKKSLRYLSLAGIKITNNDGSTKEATDINTLINEVLHTCTGVRFLNLNNISALSSIEFVKEEYDASGKILAGTPELIEIAVQNTNVTTNTTDTSGNSNGLELLNDNCKYLATISVNKAGTDLYYIQEALNKNLNRNKYFTDVDAFLEPVGMNINESVYWSNPNNYYGLYTTPDIYKTITNCAELKIIRSVYISVNSKNSEFVDLTGCSSLLAIDHVSGFLKAKLPGSLVWFNSSGNSGGYTCDFSECNKLEYINIWCATSGTQADFDNIVIALANNTELKEIVLDRFSINSLSSMNIWSNKEKLKTLKIWDDSSKAYGYRDSRCTTKLNSLDGLENLHNIENLSIGYNYCASGYLDISALAGLTNLKELSLEADYINDISALSELVNLETLNLQGNNINDITPLSGMTKLIEANLSNNQISCVKALENMKLLENLNMKNNVLYNYGYYKDFSGETKACNNVSIFGILNETGVLKNLFLDNNFIDDFTVLEELIWEEYTGW